MKIGIIGTRGIPNQYGGFEQLAQFLSQGLVQRGHEVFVYNSHSHPFKKEKWNEVHIIHCKDPEEKIGTAGQFIYDRNCLRDARTRNFDVLLHLGYTSDSIWHRQWPESTVNIFNMDGLEWKRNKYNAITKIFLRYAESLAAKHADVLIADSPGIHQYLLTRYKKSSAYIAYGAELFNHPDESVLKKYSLHPYSYSLVMARMERENNIEEIIEGYIASCRPDPLLIIGHTGTQYGKYLVKKYKHPPVVFTGGIYDPGILNNLRYYASFYFHGHSVGGTNPSLLEAMACGCTIIAHDNVFNKHVLGPDAEYFSSRDDIASILNNLEWNEPLSKRKENNQLKIMTHYNWNIIIDQYEMLMINALAAKKNNIA
jgi:glycosyltransferase involved in cell wall biosynthesis